MTWNPMDTDDIRSERESKWPATGVELRPVETGLGGDEAGVFRLTRGRERIAPVVKTGTNRVVSRSHLQWFYGS